MFVYTIRSFEGKETLEIASEQNNIGQSTVITKLKAGFKESSRAIDFN